MDSTSESNFVSALSHEKMRDEPETCLMSHHPIGGETETTGGQREGGNRQFDFVLRLRPLPGNWRTEPAQRLRAALKVLLRGFGLRAIECRPMPPPASAGPDWQARAASEARDEQRRNPRPYPSTPEERLLDEYTPDS